MRTNLPQLTAEQAAVRLRLVEKASARADALDREHRERGLPPDAEAARLHAERDELRRIIAQARTMGPRL